MNDYNNTLKKKQNLKSFLEESKNDGNKQNKTNLTSDTSQNKSYGKHLRFSNEDVPQ